MVDINRKMYERNGAETIVDREGILWLNEKQIEEELDHKNMRVTKVKYLSDHRKHRHELVDAPKKQPNRIFIRNELPTKVIMDCRTTTAHKFRARLGFKQYDAILTKEQSVLTKIKSSFGRENMQTQYSVLGYRIDLCFHDYELAIEIDVNGHSEKNIDYEIKRQKAIEQELDCESFRVDADKEHFGILKPINKIFRYIKQ